MFLMKKQSIYIALAFIFMSEAHFKHSERTLANS